MGKFNSIADGRISGKVGSLVFYEVDGRPRVRSTGHSAKPPTMAQLRCRAEMRVVTQFLGSLLEVVRLGFMKKPNHSAASPYNLAVSYQKKHAVVTEGLDAAMVYERVMLSRGPVMGALEPSVELQGNILQYNWLCPDWVGWPKVNDGAVMVGYFPEAESAVYELNGPIRKALGGQLPIPPEYAAQRIEVYLFFVSQSRNEVSDSIYLGKLGG